VYKAVEVSSGKSVAGLRLCSKTFVVFLTCNRQQLRSFGNMNSMPLRLVSSLIVNSISFFLSKFQLIDSLLRAPSHHPQAGEKHLNQLFKKKPRVTEVQLFYVLDSHQHIGILISYNFLACKYPQRCWIRFSHFT